MSFTFENTSGFYEAFGGSLRALFLVCWLLAPVGGVVAAIACWRGRAGLPAAWSFPLRLIFAFELTFTTLTVGVLGLGLLSGDSHLTAVVGRFALTLAFGSLCWRAAHHSVRPQEFPHLVPRDEPR